MQRFLSLLCIVLSLIVAASACNAVEFKFLSGQYGMVLAQTASGQAWGTICGSGGTYTFDTTSAGAMCRIMGWETLTSYSYSVGSTNSYSHKMSMHCASTSYTYPSSCSRSYSSTCTSSSFHAVYLYCYGIRTGNENGIYSGSFYLRLSKYLRRLEVRLPHTDASNSLTFGSICGRSFSTTTANRLCSWFGFSTSGYNYFTAGGGSNTIHMDNLYCSSSASTLSDCSYTTSSSSCDHSQDIGMLCKTSDGLYLSGQYLLKRQSSGHIRAKRMYSTSLSTTLGYVCDDLVTSTTAAVLYRITNGGVACSSSTVTRSSSTDSSSGVFVLDDVVCSSSSYRSLSQCTFATSHNCYSSEQLSLYCDSSSSTSRSSDYFKTAMIIFGSVAGGIVGLIILGYIIAGVVGYIAMTRKSDKKSSTNTVAASTAAVTGRNNNVDMNEMGNTDNTDNSVNMMSSANNMSMMMQPVAAADVPTGYAGAPPNMGYSGGYPPQTSAFGQAPQVPGAYDPNMARAGVPPGFNGMSSIYQPPPSAG